MIERKQAELPSFVVIPAAEVARWKLRATTTVEGTLDGVPLGRRSLKRWDDQRWFIELRRELPAARSLRSGVLIGRLALSAADGMPLCASVLPPAITWADS